MTSEIRYAIHPNDFKSLQTNQLREAFLVTDIFQEDLIKACYTHYDRFILGGAKPVATPLALQPFNALKADYFLQRREIGIINVGGKGVVSVDGKDFELEYKEALYIGRDVKEVVFHPGENPGIPAGLRMNTGLKHPACRAISVLRPSNAPFPGCQR